MSEVLEFFRQPDTTDVAMDPYGSRARLTPDIAAEYDENSTVTIRARLTLDGQPLQGIPWPRDAVGQELDTTRIGTGNAIMGLQVEKDHVKSSQHYEYEMMPQADGWFSVTTDQFPKVPGHYVYKIAAEGWYHENRAPPGKLVAYFRHKTGAFDVRPAAQPPVVQGVVVAGSLGSAGVSNNLRSRFQLTRVDPAGAASAIPGVFILPMIPRIPNANIGNGGLVVDGRRIALDSTNGDIYLSGYAGPTGPGFIDRVALDGSRTLVPVAGVADPEASAIALNPKSRTLWATVATALYVIDLGSGALSGKFDSLRPASMCADLRGDGVWAIVSATTPQHPLTLVKIDRDGKTAATVAGFTPNGSPGWLAPLGNGGVVAIGLRNREPVIVAVDGTGKITAQSQRWIYSTVDLDADAATGEVSVILADSRRRGLLQPLKADLSAATGPIDPMNRFGAIQSLITVARSGGTQSWVGGLQFNPDPPPGTEPGPIGHFGRVGQGFGFTPVRGAFRAISLAVAYR